MCFAGILRQFNDNMAMHIGILGGGISGLTLHRFLKQPSEVLEKAPVPGGLCRSFWKDGFGFDIGGHILFSKHKHVTELIDRLLGDNINHCRRANKILFKGRYVKYPFENDLGALDKQDAYECLIDYLKADFPEPTNLEEWAYATFGRAISDKYFLPYNRKIWKMEPRDMGLEWVSRIPKPPMEDVVKSALGIDTEGYTHQLFFRYPLHGGFESVVKAMIQPNAQITCNTAIRVDPQGGRRLAGFRRPARLALRSPGPGFSGHGCDRMLRKRSRRGAADGGPVCATTPCGWVSSRSITNR